jgi:DNA-binding response OmpR family regulator
METEPKRRVLIVEDDPELQKIMSVELESMGFEVLGALHYEAAVQHLTTAPWPALVCVDLELPTRSGYELCEYIRGPLGGAGVPIVVTSDTGLPEDMACAEEAGADAFLKKPFPMRDLKTYVELLLRRAPLDEPGTERPEA